MPSRYVPGTIHKYRVGEVVTLSNGTNAVVEEAYRSDGTRYRKLKFTGQSQRGGASRTACLKSARSQRGKNWMTQLKQSKCPRSSTQAKINARTFKRNTSIACGDYKASDIWRDLYPTDRYHPFRSCRRR